MANDFDAATARQQLETLDADRDRLASRLGMPWGLMAAAGAALAWFVADAATAHPGADYRASNGYLLAIAVLCIVGCFIRRETGVQFRGLGGRGWLVAAGLAVWELVMFSGSLAIVSTGHRVWAWLPVLLTWIVGTLGSAAIFRCSATALRHG